MKNYVLSWRIAGIFLFSAAAIAQTPPASTADARFDGTYAFVSATSVSETYRTTSGRMGQCGEMRHVGPLTIANGQARYTGGASNHFDGTVGTQGELAMRLEPRPGNKNTPGIEIIVSGKVDSDGTAKARQSGRLCSYDLIWRKAAR